LDFDYLHYFIKRAIMSTLVKPVETLISFFAERPCWMIAPLAEELRYSIPSVRRFLSDVGYFSSFTHNGTWYTLRSTPQFDQDGLWFHQGIGFSRAGSLTNTLVELIRHSPAGLTAEMIGDKLHCRSHSMLVQLTRSMKITRQKVGRAHLYFAADSHTADFQRQAIPGLQEPPLPAEIVVLVLVEFIRTPEATFEQLASAITRGRGVTIKAAQVEKIFLQHGLKKTPQTAGPPP
jgi:hypothetical protein